MSPNIKEIGQELTYNQEEFIKYELEIPELEIKIVSMMTKEQLLSDINKVWPLYIMIIAIMITITISTYIFLNFYIAKPLRKITSFITTLNSGNLKYLKKRVNIKGFKEVEMIAGEFNYLLDEMNDLSNRLISTTTYLYGIELAKKEAELDFLKSQINPHFLYNTLGIIKGIALIRKEKEIEEISGALAKIFRYSIKGEDVVPFKEEINIAKAYIYIQQIRFKDRFNVVYEITEEVQEVKIIKMILQPLIENAVSHGIEPISRKSTLTIGGKVDNEKQQIIILVKDNGIGIPYEQLQNLKQKLAKPGGVWNKEHVGIININERIRHVYGEDYGICIESEEGIGTEVTINIPYLY